MRISEIMTRTVEVIDPNMTVREAAQLMRDDDVGALPVARRRGRSSDRDGDDRDIAVRSVASDRQPATTTVRQVQKVYYCFEDSSLDEAGPNARFTDSPC